MDLRFVVAGWIEVFGAELGECWVVFWGGVGQGMCRPQDESVTKSASGGSFFLQAAPLVLFRHRFGVV